MLADHSPIAVVSTKDLPRARDFYERVLGFAPQSVNDEVGAVVYVGGAATFVLYRSEYAGTNKANSMAFDVPPAAIDGEVARLREAGVTFDTFDVPGGSWEDGVLVVGDARALWFHDPDGNIINVNSGM